MYVSVDALEPRGTTPTDAPDAPASSAPEEVCVYWVKFRHYELAKG